MFQVVEWQFELIFCLLNSPKLNLDEVVRAMFQVLPWHFELNFCLLTSPNYDLGVSESDV